jgi:hypothetical protein
MKLWANFSIILATGGIDLDSSDRHLVAPSPAQV